MGSGHFCAHFLGVGEAVYSCHLEPGEEDFWIAAAEMGKNLLKLRDPGTAV